MSDVLKVSIALLVGFTTGMLYKYLQFMFFNGYLAHRAFFNSWVKIIPKTATHEDTENVSTLIKQYFVGKRYS